VNNQALLEAFLNSLKSPFLFVDTGHIIRYMNKAAIAHYERGEALLGTSIFDCHNETSNATIREVFEAMLAGEEERLITDNEKHRIYMRAVRDSDGELLGYYERYEPPESERQRSGEAEKQEGGDTTVG
jgi:DUF438 domain-containing protein